MRGHRRGSMDGGERVAARVGGLQDDPLRLLIANLSSEGFDDYGLRRRP